MEMAEFKEMGIRSEFINTMESSKEGAYKRLSRLLKTKFDFLSDSEVSNFISSHTWLQDESDEGVIVDFLKSYFKGLAERHNELYLRICESEIKEEKIVAPPEQSEAKLMDLNKKEQEKMKIETEEIKYPNEDHIFASFIEKFDNLRAVYEASDTPEDFKKNMNFLFNTLYRIIKFPDNAAARQINIPKGTPLSVMDIFEALGFIKLELGYDIVYIYNNNENFDIFKQVLGLIDTEYVPGLMKENIERAQAKKAQEVMNQKGMGNPVSQNPLYSNSNQSNSSNSQNQQFNSRSEHLAAVHERRLQQQGNKNSRPFMVGGSVNNNNPVPQSNVNDLNKNEPSLTSFFTLSSGKKIMESTESFRNQIKDYRDRMKSRRDVGPGNFVPKIWTLDELKRKEEAEDQMRPEPRNQSEREGGITGAVKRFFNLSDIESKRIEEDKVTFALKALDLTNEFRKQQGLPPVNWSQQLSNIGMKHSKDMAELKVPFGHQGFDERVRQITFPHRSVCENVAYCQGVPNIPQTIVNGWINSPGHRKNLLSHSNVCGISVYRADNGRWYFTQLLALIA